MTETSKPAASLSLRLTAGALVWLAVLLALGGAVLSAAFRDAVEREFGHRLDALLHAMIAVTDVSPEGTVRLTKPLGDPRFNQIFSGWYWQISGPDGRLVRSRSLWDATLPLGPASTATGGTRVQGPKKESLLMVERNLEFPGAPTAVRVQVAGSLEDIDVGAHRFDTLLAAALALLGLGMSVAVPIQVRFGLRPLRALAADLDAVRNGVHPRLVGRYPGEVAPLAEAMNNLLDHDERLIERARTHVGNLAHGLKTPLAILQAEMHDRPESAALVDQIKVMTRLITYHLGRASAGAGSGRVQGTRVPVREAVDGITKSLSRIFADRSLVFDIRVSDDAVFRGQREDLEEMLGNLMENACKWAARHIRVTSGTSSGDLVLSVEDDGPGLDPEKAEAASRRGERLDEMAPGWGLGLSIVSDIADDNGGTTAFTRSDLGGLKATLAFPGT